MILRDLYVKDDLVQSCWFDQKVGRAGIRTASGDFLSAECDREEFLKAVGNLPDTVKVAGYEAMDALLAEFLKEAGYA